MTLSILKNFEFGENKINVYGTQDKPLFMAAEIGDLLGIQNIRQNLANIPAEWKMYMKHTSSTTGQNVTMITEQALYKLVFRSNKPFADEFTNKVCEILKEIRSTGKFELRPSSITKRLTFRIENEHDLQVAVVSFIRQFYPSCSFHSTLGELQDTSEKRIDAYCMGYSAGIPDIIITEASKGYTGMMIELKTPKGTGELSEKQNNQIKTLELKGNHVLVSNDYNLIILAIKKYLDNVRYLCLKCLKRPKAYCSLETLKKHLIGFHKIVLE